MRGLAILFIYVLSCGGLQAQTLDVRSGEHPNFSRLVFDIPIGTAWDVGRLDDGFGVKVALPETYNTSRVFDRISRRHIANLTISPSGQVFEIAPNCDCHITAFLWRPDALVVDVREGPAPADAAFDGPLFPPRPEVSLPIIAQSDRTAVPEIPLNIKESEPALLELENLVVQSLARGASQGLLTPNPAIPDFDMAQIDTHFDQNQPGIWAHTSIDRSQILFDQNPEKTRQNCLPDTYFALADWGSSLGFSAHIAQLRQEILAEFDEPDEQAVLTLARAYIFYGFGPEASHALAIDQSRSAERDVISGLAKILEGRIEPAPLFDQLHCDGSVAFWSFLGGGKVSNVQFDRNLILRTYRQLPVHVQTLLSVPLADRFTDIGDLDAAETALNPGLSTQAPITSAKITEAKLQAALGENDSAIASLEGLSQTDTGMTAAALIDYFELVYDAGNPPNPETLAVADIVRFEQRDDPNIGALAAAQIRAMLKGKDFVGAKSVYDAEIDSLGEDRASGLFVEWIKGVTINFDDPSFLEIAFSDEVASANPNAQNLLAARLLTLGFPERAGLLVAGAAIGSDMMERRFLRAQASLDQNKPEAALVHMLGQTNARAVALRTAANLMIEGQPQFGDLTPENDWRLGNWTKLAESDDPLLSSVSNRVLDPQQTPAAPDRPISAGQDLLVQSAATQSVVDQILARFEPVETSE